MKRYIVDFKFKNERYNTLAKVLKELVAGTPFEGKIYLAGAAIKNQLLGVDKETDPIEIVVATPNGGIAFSTWATFKTACQSGQTNPAVSVRGKYSRFILSNDPDIGDMTLLARQSQKYFCHNEKRAPLYINGTIEEDAQAIGFTMDSLYFNVSEGTLNDFTSCAFDDIENKIIRATNQKTTFNDDPSNILLAAEYAANYEFGIERNTWFNMIEAAPKITELSASLVRERINGILLSKKPSVAFNKLFLCDGLFSSLPYLYNMRDYIVRPNSSITVYDHTLKVVDDVPADLYTRMGALLHDVGKLKSAENGYMYHQMIGIELTKTMLSAMGYPDDFTEDVCKIVEYHDDLRKFAGSQVPGTKYTRRFMGKCGKMLDNVLDVIDANNKAQEFGKKPHQIVSFRKAIEKLIAKDKAVAIANQKKSMANLPIDGKDIMKTFGLKQSPLVGRLLEEVKLQFDKNNNMTKDDCYTVCEKVLHKIY